MKQSIQFFVTKRLSLLFFALAVSIVTPGAISQNNGDADSLDPGVRGGPPAAGGPRANLSANYQSMFTAAQLRFQEVDSVSGAAPNETGSGLGPGFNSNSCASCHSQPASGGSSPSQNQYPFIGPNPQLQAGADYSASNSIPFFITADGPVREARFPFMVNANGSVSQVPDGGVHDVFTIAGRQDAPGCVMPQPNFEQMQQLSNLIFRIPTPVFGAGLIEAIPDSTILSNMTANAQTKQWLGIAGHPNYSGNDGSITRFGWKAQNKSLEIF